MDRRGERATRAITVEAVIKRQSLIEQLLNICTVGTNGVMPGSCSSRKRGWPDAGMLRILTNAPQHGQREAGGRRDGLNLDPPFGTRARGGAARAPTTAGAVELGSNAPRHHTPPCV